MLCGRDLASRCSLTWLQWFLLGDQPDKVSYAPFVGKTHKRSKMFKQRYTPLVPSYKLPYNRQATRTLMCGKFQFVSICWVHIVASIDFTFECKILFTAGSGVGHLIKGLKILKWCQILYSQSNIKINAQLNFSWDVSVQLQCHSTTKPVQLKLKI